MLDFFFCSHGCIEYCILLRFCAFVSSGAIVVAVWIMVKGEELMLKVQFAADLDLFSIEMALVEI
jgi:hypothetical protein